MAQTAVSFTEDWFDDTSCQALAELVIHTHGKEGRIVEIGSWEGKSTCALANAAFPDIVDAVDTWRGSPGEVSSELASERDVLAAFKANVGELTNGNVAVHQSDWRDYLQEDQSPVRFVFIDATHTFDEVHDNLTAILPLVVDGGVICGDDAQHPPVAAAVLDVLGPTVNLSGRLWWIKKGAGPDIGDRYREACRAPSDINEHLPTMVGLCKRLDAKKVIELGTRGGCSTVAWLYGLHQSFGHLWSVDIDPAPEFEDERWTFIQGDDLTPAVFNQLPDDADVVFIDTSHEYAQTAAELNLYKWKVRPGGKIVLHDTELAHPWGLPVRPRFPVKTAVEEFCQEEGLSWENHPNSWGLGIISFPEE